MRPKTLPGYHHSVPFGGLVYHIQTDDLGPAEARLVSQLFLHGTVVATRQSSYGDLDGVSADARRHQLERRMQELHKSLLRDLVQGAIEPRRSAA